VRYKNVTVDLLICFECDRIRLEFADREKLGEVWREGGWSRVRFDFALYECAAQPILARFLQDAKVPLAKKRK
jgi:hypothetical protein